MFLALDAQYPLAALGTRDLPTESWLREYTGNGDEPALHRYRGFMDVKKHGDAGDVAGDIAAGFADRTEFIAEALWRRADVSHQIMHMRRCPDELWQSAQHKRSERFSRPAALCDALNSLALAETNAGKACSEPSGRDQHFERAAIAYKHMHQQAANPEHHARLHQWPNEVQRLCRLAQKALYEVGTMHRDHCDLVHEQDRPDPGADDLLATVQDISVERRMEALRVASASALLEAERSAASLTPPDAQRRLDACVALAELYLEWDEFARALGVLEVAAAIRAVSQVNRAKILYTRVSAAGYTHHAPCCIRALVPQMKDVIMAC